MCSITSTPAVLRMICLPIVFCLKFFSLSLRRQRLPVRDHHQTGYDLANLFKPLNAAVL